MSDKKQLLNELFETPLIRDGARGDALLASVPAKEDDEEEENHELPPDTDDEEE